MSSDKDSVAPERVWVALSSLLRGYGYTYLESDGGDDLVPYIRDDGDLVSRSAVVKRLREIAVEENGAGIDAAKDSKAEYHFGRKRLANALADEFEAADKDKNKNSG